ncbi:MAG: type II secretion system protein [Epsilonproteobacteria bacterium]|nr:type II secretion system protein [Campylobacterota bacterium]
MKKAFTLIELAIVLSILGILIGGGFKIYKMQREKAYVKEAKEYTQASKDAIIGYSLDYIDLPTWSEFAQNLSPVKGTISDLNKTLFYFADPDLQNDQDICTFNTTKLQVDVYKNGSLDHTISNVAFVIAARSANHNIQTYYSNNSGQYTVKTYDYSSKVDDNPSDFTRNEQYDDTIEWVTLSQLQKSINCQNNKPIIVNNYSLPRDGNCTSQPNQQCYLGTGSDDNVELVADKGFPYDDDSDQNGYGDSDSDSDKDYLWCIEADSSFIQNFSVSCGSSNNIASSITDYCNDSTHYHQCSRPILDSKKGGILNPGSYTFKVFVKDKISTKNKTLNIVIDAK